MQTGLDEILIETLMEPIRKCAAYKPAFGGNLEQETTPNEFRLIYGQDPLYHWMGLDSDLMYAAHKAAGAITSIYRQLGVGCERVFRELLRQSLNLSDDEVTWGYDVTTDSGGIARLALDARIDLAHLRQPEARDRFEGWLVRVGQPIGGEVVARRLRGAVFEVRQGYKSADSKRQHADLRSGSRAYSEGYLPVVMLFSRQMNRTVERRYRAARLLVLIGKLDGNDMESTFTFCREVVGYDLAGFFERNSERLRGEFVVILETLLSPT